MTGFDGGSKGFFNFSSFGLLLCNKIRGSRLGGYKLRKVANMLQIFPQNLPVPKGPTRRCLGTAFEFTWRG